MAHERIAGNDGTKSAESSAVSYPWTESCDGSIDDLVDWSKRSHAVLESLSVDNDCLGHCDITPLDACQPGCPVAGSQELDFAKFASGSLIFQSWEMEDVFQNAVGDEPHAQSLERILRHSHGPQGHSTGSTGFQSDSRNSIPAGLARVSPEDVIITVMLCDEKGFKEQEYDVLASQTLHDLKDALYFVGDWMYDGPRTRSACMFIDGAFYSDMRQPSAVDYARELVEWIQKVGRPKLKDEPFRTMAERFCDLEKIPFGEKSCYIRQGDIEHLMYFTGARAFNRTRDCPVREAYPCLVWMRRYQKRCCVVCKKLLASWVVLDSSRCPFNPAYFCRVCFKHFSQDEHGEYIPPLDYKVFPYLHEGS